MKSYNHSFGIQATTIRRFNENDRRNQRMRNAKARSAYQRERYLSAQRAHIIKNAREFRARKRTG